MPAKPPIHPIVIKFAHLSPTLKEIIGHPFSEKSPYFQRLASVDSLHLRLGRAIHRMSLPEFLASPLKPFAPSVRGARVSRAASEFWVPFLLWQKIEGVLSGKSFWQTGLLEMPGISESLTAGTAANRVEAARIVQFLHEQLAAEMHSSKAVVSPHFMHGYSADHSNADLISKTHPIFRVNLNGDLVFLPVTRKEYQQYRFQQSKLGKWGVQPWLWRGYLEPPNAPASWKKEAAQKLREWNERVRENWKPMPRPRPAMVRVRSVSSSAREKNLRRAFRKR